MLAPYMKTINLALKSQINQSEIQDANRYKIYFFEDNWSSAAGFTYDRECGHNTYLRSHQTILTITLVLTTS